MIQPAFIRKYLWHFIWWSVLIIGYFFLLINFRSPYKITHYLLQCTFNLLLFYGVGFLLMPYALRKRRLGLFIFLIILLIPVAGIAKYGMRLGLKWMFNLDFVHTESLNQHYYTLIPLAAAFIVAGIIAKLLIDWQNHQKIEEELRNEKTVSELMYLKLQVNPHFLFNTLNNLYYLCLQKSDNAPEMVMKLSDLMRYVVTVGKMDTVPLPEEINQLNSYIELERLRLPDPDCIKVNLSGNPENKQIAPLLLLPFVENAFKHSRDSIKLGINITLQVIGDELFFEISNHFNEADNSRRSGIGLENVKRRLELSYPENYHLQIRNDSGIFQVFLKINLNAYTIHSY